MEIAILLPLCYLIYSTEHNAGVIVSNQKELENEIEKLKKD